MSDHTLSVIINYAIIAFGFYVAVQWYRNRQDQLSTNLLIPALPPGDKEPLSKRLTKRLTTFGLHVLFFAVFSGLVFFLPESMGRQDSSAFCQTLTVGNRIDYDIATLQQNIKRFKEIYGTLYAANYYPKVAGIEDGSGAIIFVFLGGYPFSRAYCVVDLDKAVITNKQVMFNAEDYEYCNGAMRGVWECDQSLDGSSK